ncbi:interleukin-17 receptor C [Sus scrofa]|uniref:interleukin-17 receptor C n=1 Tax=Sus scrofa TaxID=9823 RepID=UPI000A2B145C|nr:interleukin-17 receptor C [Sus scrofa]
MPVPWFLLSLALGRNPVVLSLERFGAQDAARCSPTELVLRCHKETDCDLCVRVAVHLAVHALGFLEGSQSQSGLSQAHVVLSFQAYPTARCVLLEVQIEKLRLVEESLWLDPRLADFLHIMSVPHDTVEAALPWLNVSADGDHVRLVLDVSEEQRFGLSLYWNQTQGPAKPWWHRNLTGPQTITLNHTDLVPCLCIQDSYLCFVPSSDVIAPLKTLAHTGTLACSPVAAAAFAGLAAGCAVLPARRGHAVLAGTGWGPCQPLVPPLPRANVTVNVSTWEKLQLQECLWTDSLGPLKDDMLVVETRDSQDNRSLCALEPSGCTPLLSRASTRLPPGAEWLCSSTPRRRRLRAPRGALASALCQLPLRVAVDLWSRRELSAQGPLAWFHAQRRQTLQEGGVVVLLFSPGAVAMCHEWLQDAASAPGAHGPHDAFTASLSCVLPDFLQGRAPGRYIGAYFDRLLPPDAVPALFRSVPVFSLPSQLPDFLGPYRGPAPSARGGSRRERIKCPGPCSPPWTAASAANQDCRAQPVSPRPFNNPDRCSP